jgi:hypothetical protein
MSASVSAAPPGISGTSVSEVTSSSVLFEAELNPQGKATRYHFEYGLEDCASHVCTKVPLPEAEIPNPAPNSAVSVSFPVGGLTSATVYHYRLVAKNGETTSGPDRIFATYGASFEGLPDSRAYEQSSPVDKDGGDASGTVATAKAAADGSAIAFGSTFGMPGAKGAQVLPTLLGVRGASSWSTQGLLPPAEIGQRARVIGWSPDYTEVFSRALKLGSPRTEALFVQSTATQVLTMIAPYVPEAEYSFAGTDPSSSTVFFETRKALPGVSGALEGVSNLYAWDRSSNQIQIVDVLNSGSAASPKGGFAGPYFWSASSSGFALRFGGAERNSYLREMRAITPAGSIYFTAGGSGRLYLRKNPTESQSPLNGEGKCTNPALACTIFVSASQRSVLDPAGEQPAAFQAASADGSKVFFTSHEKLTDDANTGPEQPKAAIGRDTIGGNPANIQAEFIPKRAVGIAVVGSFVYWADPVGGTIGRAKVNGETVEDPDPEFIEPGTGGCKLETAPGVFESTEIPSEPRYVAVDSEYVYWTNTGLRGEEEIPRDDGGTIGRAKLNGEAVEEVEPAFICSTDESRPGTRAVCNPQGIAVNETHIYWANAAFSPLVSGCSVGRATIDGEAVKGEWGSTESNTVLPFGLALSPTHVYFSASSELDQNNNSYIYRVPLEGGPTKSIFVGQTGGLRGVALDSSHVYWASQADGAIGRIDLELNGASKENTWLPLTGALNGIALDATHIWWTVNGESATNAGNDLYRFEVATETLVDLTPDATDENGAEVQGVLGVSADGKYLYFTANADLDGTGPAEAGDCEGAVRSASGKCSLYVWHEGIFSFIARLNASNPAVKADALNWVGTPREVIGGVSSYFPKTSFMGGGGKVLLFRSQERLTEYDNEGTPELYRYDADAEQIACVSCRPSGEEPGEGPKLGSITFPSLTPPDGPVAALSTRVLSADGEHAFFESAEALSPQDTNGAGGCPLSGNQNFPACTDVYEWEAPGSGGCGEDGPAYSPLNDGCLYLISTGKSKFPSLLADASVDGSNVFFFTRDQLVGQDEDELQDVYDARVGSGLEGQFPTHPQPCESADACHGPAQLPPVEASPATPNFQGSGNLAEKHKKPKTKKHKKHRKHKGRRAKAKGRSGR